jgi:diadenosine tetraphosphate (Ap4A) HIT family hydrolase
MGADVGCELCTAAGGELLWRDELCRVVLVADADYPGFCRVIWHRHVAEMTDLNGADRRHLMALVFAVEAALRASLAPDKINLASLGNQVPHLHWHVVPRWKSDRHFPHPIWAAPAREAEPRPRPDAAALREAIIRALAEEQAGDA